MTEVNRAETIERVKHNVLEMLKQTIRPEFLNRIDETIMFTPLNKAEIKQIVSLQIESVKKMLARNGLQLEVNDNAIEFLANEGFDPEFGARPVKRAIQRLVLNDLSKQIIAQRVDQSRPITIDADAGEQRIVFSN